MSAEVDLSQGSGEAGPGETASGSEQLRVLYVTMQFPVPSEASAAVEVRALQRAGAVVSVEALRTRPPGCAARLSEHGLDDLPLGHNSAKASLHGLWVAVTRPSLVLFLIRQVLGHCAGRPRHVLRSLVLMPRVLDLFALVERERPAVVHLYWGHYPSLLGLLVERYLPSTPVSLFLGVYDLGMAYGCSGPMAQKAAVVWTLADVNRPAIERLGADPARIELCYRGVEVAKDDAGRGAKVPYRILVVERLIAEKRTDDSLRVFQRVQRSHPEASLVVLGDGPERRALQELAQDLGIAERVSFPGHVSHHEVFEHQAAAEVLLSMTQHPSERLPNALKEAMLRRCACVVARSPGIEELLSEGVDGFIVAPGDIAAAADRIDRLFTDPELAGSLAGKARKTIIQRFDVDRLTDRRLAVWRERLPRRQPGKAAATR